MDSLISAFDVTLYIIENQWSEIWANAGAMFSVVTIARWD